MKENKKMIGLAALLLALVLALFNVVAFAAPFTRENSFWTGYAFVMFSITATAALTVFDLNAQKPLTKRFYTIPEISLSFKYVCVQAIVGIIFMFWYSCPVWISLIIQFVILTVFAIMIVKIMIARTEVERIDENVKTKTFFIKSLIVDAECLSDRAKSAEVKAEIKKVYETARYSDPMSNNALESIESQISIRFATLESAVIADDVNAVKSAAEEVIILLKERNKKVKLLK